MGEVRKHLNKNLIIYTAICAIGTLLFGWEVGMLNILYSMKSSFGAKFGMYEKKGDKWVPTDIKTKIEMFVTPSFTVGSVLGALLVNFIVDRMGRSKSLHLTSVIYFIGVVIQITFAKVYTLCLGRFISGIAAGIATTISPLYMSEIAPKQVRGTLGVIIALGLQFGKLFACLYETLCLKLITGNPTLQWRIAISGLAFPSIIFLLVVWFLPETPRYLLMKNRDDEALDTLARIREKSKDEPEVADEFKQMSIRLKADMTRGVMSWSEILADKSLVYRVIIVIILELLRMLVGVAAISYFSTQIYENYLKIPTKTYGAWLATFNAAINIIFAIPVAKYIEKFGRRKTLLCSSSLLFLSMALTFTFCLIVDKTGNKICAVLCVLAMYLYTITNTAGWDAIIPVWQSEIFPISARAKANAAGWFFKYIGSILVTSTTSTFLKYLKYYTFWIYGSFCFISFVFIYFNIRETKGLTLEETEMLYRDKEDYEKKYKEDLKIEKKNQEKTESDITNA